MINNKADLDREMKRYLSNAGQVMHDAAHSIIAPDEVYLIPTEMGTQGVLIAQLEELVNKLTARLSPVMTPVPPEVANDCLKASDNISELAQLLKSSNFRIESVCQSIAKINSRLEV